MNSVKIRSFFDSEGRLLKNLVSDQGTDNIKDIINHIREADKLNINQLRKFYDSFLKIYNNKAQENERKIQLLMLKANSEYSAKRLRTHQFNEFLSNRIDIVVSKSGDEFIKNLKALKLHLESFVAYYPKS